jgi:CRISPR/Cas system-associated exonuclease Cas4 (RecB family)
MSEIANQIEEIIDQRLDRLLLIEKERRGVSENSLVFIGMANIADLHWCGMQSVLRSRRDEDMYFASYLYDRLLYSYALGIIEKLPRQNKRLLEIGNEVTQAQIERLLKKLPQRKRARRIEPEKVRSELQKLSWKERGVEAERLLSESYRSIRWNFEWDKYVAVGVPDGITDQFVYEFKTTGKLRYVQSNQTKAFTQADLYGYFFKRPRKRVQLYILENARIETWEKEVDTKNALSTLEYFNRIDSGLLPDAPEAFKCRICEFANECPILHNKAGHV